ncbi:RND family transporter [Alienimonas sp. DA493]|uniref:efflux RND transporter permease subunit n=1 Tax=Alienimonas sp. DA493 TaxID=3373605 RepID=UPI00375536A6
MPASPPNADRDDRSGRRSPAVPRASWALAAFCLVLPVVGWGLSQIHLENDVESWLPEGDPDAARLAWFKEHFPNEDTLVLSWPGVQAGDPKLEEYAAAIRGRRDEEGIPRGGSRLIAHVVTPTGLAGRMVETGVDPDDAVDRVTGLLVGGGPLRVVLTEAGKADPATAAERLAAAVRVAANVEPEVAPAVDVSPYGDLSTAAADPTTGDADGEPDFTFPVAGPHDLTVRWPRMDASEETLAAARTAAEGVRDAEGRPYVEEVFRVPGQPAAVSVTLSEAGAADPKATVAALQDAAEAIGVPKEDLRIGGRTVTAVALNEALKRTALNREAPVWKLWERSPVLLSFLVSSGLAFWLLGGLRVSLCVLGATLFTVLTALSIVPLTGGGMNMVLVVMPSLLTVLTLSAGVHLVNYYRHAAEDGRGNAVARALSVARTPTSLAAATTAVGLVSLGVSPLVPVREFGIYSSIGCGIMLAVVLFGLPALLEHLAPPPSGRGAAGSLWEKYAAGLTRWRLPVIGGCLLAAAVCSAGLTRFRTETKVIKYFPPTAPVVQDYGYFEDRITGVVPVDVVVRFDQASLEDPQQSFTNRMELVRAVAERIEAHPEISGAISLASFRPPSEPLAPDAGRFARIGYFRRARETQLRVQEDPSSATFLTTAHTASPSVDGDEPMAAPGDELWRISAQANILTDVDYADLTADLHAAAADVLKDQPGAGYAVTGLVPLFLRTQEAVLEGLIDSFGLAFAVIAVVMSIVLGSVRAGLTAMLPNILPVTAVFGLVSWFWVPVDIGTMISASVALGIAVDGTLHLVAAFRHAPAGLSREDAAAHALHECGPALWQTSLIVGIGLLMLAPAELLLVSRFGWLMSALIAAALIADVVLLPALLAGPMGSLIRRCPASEQGDDEDASADDPPASAEAAADREEPRRVTEPEPRPQLAAFTRPA